MFGVKIVGFVVIILFLINSEVALCQGGFDPGFDYQWGLHNTGQTAQEYGGTIDADIDAPEAWEIWTGNGNVNVAILDNGLPYRDIDDDGELDFDHPDIDYNRVVRELNLYPGYERSDPPKDGSKSHGTGVTGVISAISGNGEGIMGLCWNCRLYVAKIYTEETALYWETLNDAIEEFDDQVDVINMSNSDCICSDGCEVVRTSIENASNKCLFVASAGNDNKTDEICYPARFASEGHDNVISVAATMDDDTRASYSNYGPGMVMVAAPGGVGAAVESPEFPSWEEGVPAINSILSTVTSYNSLWPGNYYGWISHTSAATPHVTGLAALLKSFDRAHGDILTPAKIREIICLSADKVHRDTYGYMEQGEYGARCDELGYGRINAYKALFRLKAYGNIITDVTWHNDIELSDDVIVDEGVTLTIDPGVTVTFASNAKLIVNGTLKAIGEYPNGLITFTSSSGNWGGIIFNPESDGVNSKIEYCDIHKAVTGITLNNVSLSIKHSLLYDCSEDGIKINNSSGCEIVNNTIDSNDESGINCVSSSFHAIKNNIITNNGICGIEADDDISQYFWYNNVWNNVSDYCVTPDQKDDDQGNKSFDPLFVDSENGDYTLQVTSPCIDSGDPDFDSDGVSWENDSDDRDPDGTRMDLGALFNIASEYAAIEVVPYNLDFGEVLLGNSTTLTLKIYSTGSSYLDIYDIASDNTSFEVLNPSFPQTVAPGANIDVTVRFTPFIEGE